jgi:phosphoglycerate dehydrogenase-like enzyme
MVAAAEILWIGNNDPDGIRQVVGAARNLRWLTTHGAGVEAFPLNEIRDRHIHLTHGAGLSAIPVAEFALLGMLALAKDFPSYVRAQARTEWLFSPPCFDELAGTKALIIGYGAIGRAIAQRLRAFDVEVTGVRRRPDGEAFVIGPEAWHDRLPDFDWIVLAAPLTSDTHALLGDVEFSRFRPGSRIVNVARGGLVDQSALVTALYTGAVAGAYLDVTDPEPTPAASALWRAPNVILSAHLSGSATRHLEARAATLFLNNLPRFQASQPLLNQIHP